MLATSLLLALALIVIVKSSDGFVHFSTRIARKFGVSQFIIGATLVAIGTSLPELANTIIASLEGVGRLAYGNIIGSNMSNIGISVGLSILVATVTIPARKFKMELVALMGTTLLFFLIALDRAITRTEGWILLVLAAVYFLHILKVFDLRALASSRELTFFVDFLGKHHARSEHARATTARAARLRKRVVRLTRKIWFDIAGVLVSGALLLAASALLVAQASALARILGLAESVIGATIVAIGTTTPEMSVSLASVRKGYYHLFLGNVIGSNIVNLLLILGIGAAIAPLALTHVGFLLAQIMILSTAIFFWMVYRGGTMRAWKGALLLGLSACFVAAGLVFG